MNSVAVVLGLCGWAIAGLAVVGLVALRRREAALRAALAAPPGSSLPEAVDELVLETGDRIAAAEAMQHWLYGALDQAGDAVIVIDRIGREVVRNAAARHFGGARHSEVLAEDALRELLQQSITGRSAERELQLFGPPRQILQLTAYPLRSSGEVIGAVGFMRDISEGRRVESVRRDFVANVSHELKTPIGALGLLAETMAASDDVGVMQQLADRVVRESDRLARMVDDLLDLSQIEAQEAPTREPLPISLLVSEAVDHVTAAAETAGLPLQVAPCPAGVEVYCNHRQLRSALVNLLDNAIKYSSSGQAVEVRVAVVADRVQIAVQDHGIGIPTRDLERIFERFYRVDRARSRDTGGTGLGLAIVRHVVQAHGGEITVQSREGEGSTFTLILPIANGGGGPVRSIVMETG